MTEYEITPRFLVVTAGERPTGSGYSTDSVLFDTADGRFYVFNGTTWISRTLGKSVLTSLATGDILVLNSSGEWVNLAKGTNNRFFGVDATGNMAYNFVANGNIAAHTSTQITITAKAQLNSQIAYKDVNDWLTDAMVGAHTSTKITITDKTHLNTNIAYKDELAWLTEAMMGSTVLSQIKGPVLGRKKGGYYGTSSTFGDGILGGIITGVGTSTGTTMDSTYGTYYRYTTGGVSGNAAGHKGITTLSMRKFNPIIGLMLRPSIVTNNRVYAGLISSSTDPASGSEDPLSNLSGIMVVQRSTDTTYQVCSNDGTNATSIFANTGVTVSATVPITILFRADDANSKWQWSVDLGVNWTDVATRFPGQTTALFYMNEIQTAEGNPHVHHVFATHILSDH